MNGIGQYAEQLDKIIEKIGEGSFADIDFNNLSSPQNANLIKEVVTVVGEENIDSAMLYIRNEYESASLDFAESAIDSESLEPRDYEVKTSVEHWVLSGENGIHPDVKAAFLSPETETTVTKMMPKFFSNLKIEIEKLRIDNSEGRNIDNIDRTTYAGLLEISDIYRAKMGEDKFDRDTIQDEKAKEALKDNVVSKTVEIITDVGFDEKNLDVDKDGTRRNPDKGSKVDKDGARRNPDNGSKVDKDNSRTGSDNRNDTSKSESDKEYKSVLRSDTFAAFDNMTKLYNAHKNNVEIKGVVPTRIDVCNAVMGFMKSNILETLIIRGVCAIADAIAPSNDVEKNESKDVDKTENKPDDNKPKDVTAEADKTDQVETDTAKYENDHDKTEVSKDDKENSDVEVKKDPEVEKEPSEAEKPLDKSQEAEKAENRPTEIEKKQDEPDKNEKDENKLPEVEKTENNSPEIVNDESFVQEVEKNEISNEDIETLNEDVDQTADTDTQADDHAEKPEDDDAEAIASDEADYETENPAEEDVSVEQDGDSEKTDNSDKENEDATEETVDSKEVEENNVIENDANESEDKKEDFKSETDESNLQDELFDFAKTFDVLDKIPEINSFSDLVDFFTDSFIDKVEDRINHYEKVADEITEFADSFIDTLRDMIESFSDIIGADNMIDVIDEVSDRMSDINWGDTDRTAIEDAIDNAEIVTPVEVDLDFDNFQADADVDSVIEDVNADIDIQIDTTFDEFDDFDDFEILPQDTPDYDVELNNDTDYDFNNNVEFNAQTGESAEFTESDMSQTDVNNDLDCEPDFGADMSSIEAEESAELILL